MVAAPLRLDKSIRNPNLGKMARQRRYCKLRKFFVAFSDTLTTSKPRTMPRNGPLKGKTVCFTGKLSRTRKIAQKQLEKAGGKFAGSLTQRVEIVVAGAGPCCCTPIALLIQIT